MSTAAAKDAWECAEGRENGQNDPTKGGVFAKPTVPAPPPPVPADEKAAKK